MLKHSKLTEARIRTALPRLKEKIYSAHHPVELAAWTVGGEPVPAEHALRQTYEPFTAGRFGQSWGKLWDTTWFRIRGRVPESWQGKETVVLFRLIDSGVEGFSAEGLIYKDGKPDRAINLHRAEIEIAREARGGESFEVFVEAAANYSDFSGIVIKDSGELRFKVLQSELACLDREIFDYYYDFKVCAEAMDALPEESQRRAELRTALNESLNEYEHTASVARGRGALQDVLSRRNGGTVHRLSAVGHAHIDTAWLWPLRETIRKCARTFATAADYMDRYPEYIFGCSQAQQYAWMKAHYPDIYERIKERIKRGQWEPLGSMWIEVDCNLVSGESLVRQFLYGKRYFQEEFGYETKDAWIPDVFGYAGSLPQIIRGCGLDYFLTQKMSWNQLNKFPHHTFSWEGIDGTKVFTHFPPADTYNSDFAPQLLRYNVDNFLEHGRATRSIFVYGYGDGGGGPSIAMLEQAARLRDFEGLPQIAMEKALDFFPKAHEDAGELPVWVGELYLETHRGTYTTHARTKLGNRKSELLLRDAEFFDVLSALFVPGRKEHAEDPPRAIYDVTGTEENSYGPHRRALERAWKLVLLNQFHDIIPGSSIGWVYEDNARDYQTVRVLAESVKESSLDALAPLFNTAGMSKPVCVMNTLAFSRREVLELPEGELVRVEVPSAGYVVQDFSRQAADEKAVTVRKEGGSFILQNGILRLEIDEQGLISGLWDIEAEREVLAPGERGNVFHLHPDVPIKSDAWDVDIFYKERVDVLTQGASVKISREHPLRADVEIERAFGGSRLRQKVVLNADSRRIDFVTWVDWRERHKFLKVAFPVNVRSTRATYEIQFGHVERPTHYNTSWDLARFEVCAQRWADLSEPGYGVALLNDCKYGYDIANNVLRLSLLRAPVGPDPETDQGEQFFTYSLYPHRGTLQDSGVIEAALALNSPLLARPLPADQSGAFGAKQSWIQIDRPGVYLEAVKAAENGDGMIVRLYEGHGARGPVTITVNLPVQKAVLTNLVEQDQKPLRISGNGIKLDLKPFEIVSLRLS